MAGQHQHVARELAGLHRAVDAMSAAIAELALRIGKTRTVEAPERQRRIPFEAKLLHVADARLAPQVRENPLLHEPGLLPEDEKSQFGRHQSRSHRSLIHGAGSVVW